MDRDRTPIGLRLSRIAAPEAVAPDSGLDSALLLLGVWTLLLAAQAIGARIGRSTAVLVSFALATLLLLAARPAGPRIPRAGAPALLAGLAGFAAVPACLRLIGWVGLALGLTPGESLPPSQGDPALWISMLVLAPLFEEILYRERLLRVLRERLGTPAAVLATSLLFALPHLGPWALLGSFLIGLLLGSVMSAGRSVTLCVALHAGLNLGVIRCGVPPVECALPPIASAVAGSGLLAAALLWQREGRCPLPRRRSRGRLRD